MKKKFICALALSLLFSSTNLVQAVTINNYSQLSQVNIAKQDKDYSNVKDLIKKKAETLVNGTLSYNTSVQYAISEGDNIIISDNVGKYSKTENKLLTKDNMYGIGSISKMYVTTAVMQLVDEGKVDLDLPLVNYMPDFEMKDDNYTKITPRMLINHSSGIMGSSLNNALLLNDNDTKAHDNLLSVLANERLKAEPGEFSVYCNDGFSLAEILVERLSGMSFTEYVAKNITGPLNLKNTKTPLDKFDRSALAKTYRVNKDKDDLPENFMAIGAAGMYASAEDICKFTHAITNKDKGILSEKSIKAMAEKEYLKGVWANDAAENATGYGLGWDSVNVVPFNRYNITALSKGGDTLAYHSCTITIPEYDITMSVVSSGNTTSTINEAFASQALLELLKDKGIINEILPNKEFKEERSQCMPKYLKDEYEGLYIINNKLSNITIDEDGTLTTEISPDTINNNTKFHHTYSGYFMSDDGTCGLKFVKEKNGCTYLEMRMNLNLPGLSQIVVDDYTGQRIEENKLSKDVRDAWNNRKLYFLLNDKYSSAMYALGGCFIGFGADRSGYIGENKIKDTNLSLTVNKIPDGGGRDLTDYKFFKEGEIEYLSAKDYVFASEDYVKPLEESTNKVSISKDGYTKWFSVPATLNGKTINVTTPEHGAFIVYGADGQIIDSYITGVNSVKLQADSYIAFVGDKNVEFDVEVTD